MEPGTPPDSQRYQFADLKLCVGERRLSRGNDTIPLSRLSFEFLLALVEAAPNLVSHEALGARVWGQRRVVTPENIAKRALMLRNALGDHADHPRYFAVLRGQGYRLLPEVEAIAAPSTASRPGASALSRAAQRRYGLIGIAGAIALVAAIVLAALDRIGPAPVVSDHVVRFELVTEASRPFVTTHYSRDLAVSADGETVAYTTTGNAIVVRHLERLEPRLISNLGSDVRNPSFSPDGLHLAFLDGGALKRTPATIAGRVTTLANVGQFTDGDISWTADGYILVANSRGLLRVPETGGTPERLLPPDASAGERAFGSPGLLPDGRSVIFSIEPTRTSIGSRIAVYDLGNGRKATVMNDATQPTYLMSGHLAYVAQSELRAARFDLHTLSVSDDFAVLAQDVRTHTNGTAAVDISDDGTVIYVTGSTPPVRDLVWVERDGSTSPLPVPQLNYTYPRLSPLGTHIALDVRWPDSDIWIWDVERSSLSRVTHDPAENALPVWHPDGQQLAFGDGRSGFANVYMHSLNSGAEPTRLTTGERRQLPFSISPDGLWLLVGEDQTDGNWNMWSLNLETGERTELLLGPYSFWNTDISPDGRWLVYQSDESGELEVYVRPLPNTGDNRWKISPAGGAKPMWSRDGREIYYIDPDGRLIAAEVETDHAFGVSRSTPLFDTKKFLVLPWDSGARPFDLSTDGLRFVFVRNVADRPPPRPRIVVALDTLRLIERL